MKKFAIILMAMLVCFMLFSGCADKKSNNPQDQERGNSVEIDDADIDGSDADVDTAVNPGTDDLPDSFIYSFKDPDNADGIVVTPRE